MKTTYLVAGVFAVLCVACHKNHGSDNSPLSKDDVFFMQTASYSNLAEIDAGTIASTRGNSDSVKDFGSMMIGDHTKAENSLQSIASSLDVNIPNMPDSVHQQKAAMLKTLSGYTFDTAYINGQVMDHEKTIAAFKQEISVGTNHSVLNYAKTNLPTIEMHLQEAETIQQQLK